MRRWFVILSVLFLAIAPQSRAEAVDPALQQH
jgi:hypothetical protein